MSSRFLELAWLCFLACELRGSEFRNLGFEEVNTSRFELFPSSSPPIQGSGQLADVLPGWRFYEGNSELPSTTHLGYDLNPIGSSPPTIISRAAAEFFGVNPSAVEGNYALLLSSSGPYAIAQQGDVPVDAVFLRYNRFGTIGSLSIDGNVLAPISTSSEFLMYDVSAFAGRSVDLRLGVNSGSALIVDNISFIIPEPSSLSLFGLGSLIFMSLRRMCS